MFKNSGSPTLPMGTKLHGLDTLRALAITMVFIFHYGRMFEHPAWVNTIGKFGWTGVDLFFVLSGYLIASQLFDTIVRSGHIPLKTFFIKRFFRIIPPYLVVVAIYFCFPFVREREALAPLWKYLTFTQNLGLDLRTQGTFSHAWSLCIEEQFYLVLPLILALLVYVKAIKKGFVLLIAFFLFGFVVRYFSYQHFIEPFLEDDFSGVYWYTWIYYPTYCRLDGLLVGVSIAGLFQFKPLLKEKITLYGNLLLAIGIAILAAAYFLCLDEKSFEASIFGFPLVALGYGFLVMGAISPSSFLFNLNAKFITKIATLSYAIYLTHKIVIHLTQVEIGKLNIAKDGLLMFFICSVTSICGALILNLLIEKPFLLWRNKTLRNQS